MSEVGWVAVAPCGLRSVRVPARVPGRRFAAFDFPAHISPAAEADDETGQHPVLTEEIYDIALSRHLTLLHLCSDRIQERTCYPV